MTDAISTPNQAGAVLTALTVASNVLAAVAPEAPAALALIQLVVTLIQQNRDPTPGEWATAITGIDTAHDQAQRAMQAALAAKQAVVATPTAAP